MAVISRCTVTDGSGITSSRSLAALMCGIAVEPRPRTHVIDGGRRRAAHRKEPVMSAETAPATSASAGTTLAPLVLPPGTLIHIIAFAGHNEACDFADEMCKRANRHRNDVACTTIVVTRGQFIRAAQAQVAVMLVSAHGPATKEHEPVVGDGLGNRVLLRSLGQGNPFTFGARAGMVWDTCFAGQPPFRSELTRLSAPGVAHIAPTGNIKWPHSVHMAATIIDGLLAADRPPVTPASFAALAAKATASSRIELWHSSLAGEIRHDGRKVNY
jgi:hypothetical protein